MQTNDLPKWRIAARYDALVLSARRQRSSADGWLCGWSSRETEYPATETTIFSTRTPTPIGLFEVSITPRLCYGRRTTDVQHREQSAGLATEGPSITRPTSIMTRAFAFLACLVALIAQASAFMFAAPGSVVGAAASIRAQQGAAVSGFTGYNTVCHRETAADHSTLRMMVSLLCH